MSYSAHLVKKGRRDATGRRMSQRLWTGVVMSSVVLSLFGAAQPADGMVTNINDSGPGSLRQAISDAGPGDIVEISVNGIMQLTSQLVIDKPLTIRLAASSAGVCVLDGGDSNRLFHITAGPTTLSGNH
jgi:hypothetical protein